MVEQVVLLLSIAVSVCAYLLAPTHCTIPDCSHLACDTCDATIAHQLPVITYVIHTLASSQHLVLLLLASCCSVSTHLGNRQYGKASSALQDSCWYALLGLQIPNLGKAVEYVGGLVDVRLQATAQWAVQPGPHHAAICDIMNCWPHCLCNGACRAHSYHSTKCKSRNAYSSILTTPTQALKCCLASLIGADCSVGPSIRCCLPCKRAAWPRNIL